MIVTRTCYNSVRIDILWGAIRVLPISMFVSRLLMQPEETWGNMRKYDLFVPRSTCEVRSLGHPPIGCAGSNQSTMMIFLALAHILQCARMSLPPGKSASVMHVLSNCQAPTWLGSIKASKMRKNTRKLGWFRQWHMIFRRCVKVSTRHTWNTWYRMKTPTFFPWGWAGGFWYHWETYPSTSLKSSREAVFFDSGWAWSDVMISDVSFLFHSDCGGFTWKFAQILGWVEAGNQRWFPLSTNRGLPAQDKVDPLATLPQSGWIWAGMCEDSSCQNWMNMVKAKAYVVFNEAISYISHDFTVSN